MTPLRSIRILVAALALIAALPAVAAAQERAAPPAPQLFDVAWDDRDDILAGLLPLHRAAADRLADAPVYHLDWVLEAPRRLRARMELRVVNDGAEPWESLVFQLHPVRLGGALEVTEARVDGVPALFETGSVDGNADGGAVLTLPLARPLEPGAAVVAGFDYTVEVPTEAGGNYGLLALDGGILSLPHAYPTLAVRESDGQGGGGWDLDPHVAYGDLGNAVSAFYRLRLSLPAALDVVASGAETSRLEGGRRVVEVRAGPVRDLYVSVSEYEVREREVGGVRVRSFARPGDEAAAARALDVAATSLELFGDLYGPYPYSEFDLVPLVTGALGVEFPGVVALALRLYETGPGGGLLEGVVVHEVAHQWFYALVGNDQISDPWLDESLAQYATLRYFEEVYGAAGAEGFARSLAGRSARVAGAAERFIGAPVADYSPGEYGALVYGTGPLLLAELAEDLGAEAFEAGLGAYARAFRWRRAEGADLFAALEAACDCPVPQRYRDAFLAPGSAAR